MSALRTIHCDAHGNRPLRFVCIHVARSTDSGTRVGFFWDESEEPFMAWCAECDSRSADPHAFKAAAQFVMFCGDCYELAKGRLHGAAPPPGA